MSIFENAFEIWLILFLQYPKIINKNKNGIIFNNINNIIVNCHVKRSNVSHSYAVFTEKIEIEILYFKF